MRVSNTQDFVNEPFISELVQKRGNHVHLSVNDYERIDFVVGSDAVEFCTAV